MPRVPYPGFIGPAYRTRSVVHGVERLVNLYAEENVSTKQWALYPTPGLTPFVTLPGGACRALYTASSGRVFAVAGSRLYELFAGGVAVARGDCPGLGPVALADNGQAVLLVNGQQGFVFDLGTNTYQPVTDPDFPPATAVAFLDGYFVVNVPGTGRFMLTGLYDPLNVNALDMATAEASPDPIVTLWVDHRELWLFGTQTIEVWFNSGAPSFPLERIAGAVMMQGCIAPWSVQSMDNTLYWLHGNTRGQGALMRARGYQPEEVTPPALEWQWRQYPTRDDAWAYTYRDAGHSYYVLSFPAGQATWALDTSTMLWHERAYLEPTGRLGRHLGCCHTFGLGKHLVGDYRHGQVYALEEQAYTDAGREIVRVRRAPHLRESGVRVRYHALEVAVEAGVGLDGDAAAHNVDPTLRLSWSNDAGAHWHGERWTSVGKIGERQRRIIWRQLGQARSRVFEVQLSDAVPLVMLGAWLDLTPDAH